MAGHPSETTADTFLYLQSKAPETSLEADTSSVHKIQQLQAVAMGCAMLSMKKHLREKTILP